MTYSSVRVGEICNLVNGKAFKPEDWSDSGEPIIRIQNLNDPSKPFNYWNGSLDRQILVRPDDVLLAWSGTPGTSFGAHIWKGPPGILNQHIFRVDLDEQRICKPWCVFAINVRLDILISQAHGGVGLKHVTRGMVDNLEIPLPPLDEQRRIAAILDQADALRRKRREALTLLEQLPRAIFAEMFGESTSVSKEMVVPLSEIAELINGDRSSNYPSGDDILTAGVLFLSTKNIAGSEIDLTEANFISDEKFASLSKGKLQRNDLIITLRGTLGQCAIFDCSYDTGFINAQMMIIRPKPLINPVFLRELIADPTIQTQLKGNSSGSAVPQLTARQIGELVISVPPIKLQEIFSQKLAQCRSQVLLARNHLAKLDSLFASLQHRAFRGEL